MTQKAYDDLGLPYVLERPIKLLEALESGDAAGLELESWLVCAVSGRCEWVDSVCEPPQVRCHEEAVRGPMPRAGGILFRSAKVCAKHKALLQGIAARTSHYKRMLYWPLERCVGPLCPGDEAMYEVVHSDVRGGLGSMIDSRTTLWCKSCYTSVVCGGVTLGAPDHAG